MATNLVSNGEVDGADALTLETLKSVEVPDLFLWLQGDIECIFVSAKEEENRFHVSCMAEGHPKVMQVTHLLSVDFEDQITRSQPCFICRAALFDAGDHYCLHIA
jgi:hypothetical protein